MGKITIPYSATTGADQTPTEEVNQSFFSSSTLTSDQDSGAAINGSLQDSNLAMFVSHEQCKRGAYSRGGAIGTTDNLDYFPDIFSPGRFITQHPTAALVAQVDGKRHNHLAFPNKTSFFQPIPGLNQTFYNPYPEALAIFTWNMSLAIDGWADKPTNEVPGTHTEDNNLGAWIIFKLTEPDGTVDTRGVNDLETAFRSVLPKADAATSGGRRGAQNDLYYSGHMTLRLREEGWYTAGLHIGFAGTKLESAQRVLSLFGLQDSKMPGAGAVQDPEYYEVLYEAIGEDFTVWGEGIRQARVRVRSLRHVLFCL